MLKILVLGHPVILYKEKPHKIQRRQLRTMLCFLACQPDGISRDEILTRFWPEKTETVGRRHLREILSKLRNQLPDPEIIQTGLDRIWLNKDLVYSDFFEYQDLVKSVQQNIGHANIKSPGSANLLTRLEEAVDLWRSPGFWDGGRTGTNPEFDNWLQDTSSLMELNLIQNLEQLANHFSDNNEFDRAIYYTQIALKTDEHNEELQDQLLSLLYKAGRISEAQTFYSYLTELYKREYDDSPPEFIQQTINQASQLSFEDQNTSESHWRLDTNANHHFVGRFEELELLRKKSHQGDVVLIIGEAGAGKTRLVQQFFNSYERKPRLFLANCHPLESVLPLQPLIDLIRNFITEDDWINLDPQWLQPLSILVPGFLRVPKGSNTATISPPNLARSNLFEAIRQLFISAARSSRILFVLDDAHWSDLGTLEVLMYLVERNFFSEHGLCIINSRLEVQNKQVHDLLFKDQLQNPITRINLELMEKEEVAELVRYNLGQTPTDSFLQRIFDATGGNPLFVIETINALLASTSDITTVQEQSVLPLAKSISLIVKEKEENISEQARLVLSIAAVCGTEFQIDVLELIEGINPLTLISSIEELENQRLIQPVFKNRFPGTFSFIHSLIRETVVARLSHARKCRLHNLIATAMSASQSHVSNQYASLIARHFEEAGRPLPAFRNWVKAGQYARGLYATYEAYVAFHNADNIRALMESALSEDDLYHLYSEWGDLAYTVMDLPMLSMCYTAMHTAGEQKSSSLLIGAGLSGLALSAVFSLENEQALVLLEQSIAVLTPTNHTYEKILALSRLGIALSFGLQNQKGVEMFQSAIELGKQFESAPIRQAVATVQFQLSCLYSIMGFPIKARETGLQSLKNAYLIISNATSQSQAHLALALADYYSGDFDKMQGNYNKCLRISEPMQNHRVSTLAYLIKARVCLATGKLGEGWDLAQKALTISIENGFFENVSEAHCVMGDFYTLIGDFSKAIEEYMLGSNGILESHQGMNCYYRMGYAIAGNVDTVRGMEILEHAIQFSRSVGLGAICLPAQTIRAMILKKTGRIEEAEEILQQIKKEAASRGLQTVFTLIDTFEEKFCLDPGDFNDIERTIQLLIQQPNILTNHWLQALAFEMNNRLKNNVSHPKQEIDKMCQFLENIQNNKGDKGV